VLGYVHVIEMIQVTHLLGVYDDNIIATISIWSVSRFVFSFKERCHGGGQASNSLS